MSLKSITAKQFLIKDKLNLEHINLLFCTCLKPPIKYKLRLSPCKRTQHYIYWMLDVGSVCARCCMLLRVVVSSYITQSLKPVKLLSQRLIAKAQPNNVGSVAQIFEHCWHHARALQVVQKVFWVVSFPRCAAVSFHAI